MLSFFLFQFEVKGNYIVSEKAFELVGEEANSS